MSVSFIVTTKQQEVLNPLLAEATHQFIFEQPGWIELDAEGHRALHAILQDAWFKSNLVNDESAEAIFVLLEKVKMLDIFFPTTVEPEPEVVPETTTETLELTPDDKHEEEENTHD